MTDWLELTVLLLAVVAADDEGRVPAAERLLRLIGWGCGTWKYHKSKRGQYKHRIHGDPEMLMRSLGDRYSGSFAKGAGRAS